MKWIVTPDSWWVNWSGRRNKTLIVKMPIIPLTLWPHVHSLLVVYGMTITGLCQNYLTRCAWKRLLAHVELSSTYGKMAIWSVFYSGEIMTRKYFDNHISLLFISELCSNRMKNRAILWVFSSIVWLTIFMSWYTHVKYSIDILYFLKTKVAKIEKYSRNFIWKQALIRYFGQSLKET